MSPVHSVDEKPSGSSASKSETKISKQDSIKGLKITSRGLRVMFFGSIGLTLSVFIIVASIVSRTSSNNQMLNILLGIGILVLLVAGILQLFGHFLCLAVPAGSRCRIHAFISLGVYLSIFIVFVMLVVFQIWSSLQMPGGNNGQPQEIPTASLILQSICAAFGLLYVLCFLIFLKRINVYIKRLDLAQDIKKTINWFAIFVLLYLCLPYAVYRFRSAGEISETLSFIVFAAMAVVFVMAFGLAVLFCVSIRNTYRAIDYEVRQFDA